MSSSNKFSNGGSTYSGFPSPFAPRSEKNKISYGLQVFRAIVDGTKEYRNSRLKQIDDSNMFAEGKQPITPYLKEMNFSEDSLYTNIPFDPSPIASKFEKNVIDGYKLKKEVPKATADGKHIKDRKEEKRMNLQYRMNYESFIQEISQEVGFNIEDPNVEVPRDKEGLDLMMALNDKEKEELLMQDMIRFALKDNNQENKKRAFLSDIFRHSFGGYFNYIDHKGRLTYDIIRPEDAFYSVSHNELFNTDIQYAGHQKLSHISDIRSRFNVTPEDEIRLYKLARKYSGKYTNYGRLGEWDNKYKNCDNRPYDNFVVPLSHVWIKTSKVIGYLEGFDRNGRDIFDIKDETPYNKETTRKKAGEKIIATSYEGWFAGHDGTVVLDWGESKNILRDGLDKEEVLCPYIFFMPDNRGSMMTPSAIQMIKPYIKSIDVARIKLKHAIANAAPAGYAIDVDALMELDLGGGEDVTPLEIADIHRQTGTIYYRGLTEEGKQSRIPVTPLNPDISGAINSFVAVYNMELAQIRDTLGVNEFRDGSASNPRTGFRFAQAQAEASNTATTYIQDAYMTCTKELVRQIGIRIWDALVYGQVNKGYLQYLGKENIDFLKYREDITSSNYDFTYEMVLSGEELQRLETYLQTCLANGSLQMDDVLMVLRVEDPILAEKTLSYLLTRRQRINNEQADERSRISAEANAQAGQVVEEAQRKTKELEAQLEISKTTAKNDGELKTTSMKGLVDMINNYVKLGQQVPDVIMNMYLTMMQETVLKSEQGTMEAQQQIQMEAQAQQAEQIQMELQNQVADGTITEDEAIEIMQSEGML